jgi:hypothetical protein
MAQFNWSAGVLIIAQQLHDRLATIKALYPPSMCVLAFAYNIPNSGCPRREGATVLLNWMCLPLARFLVTHIDALRIRHNFRDNFSGAGFACNGDAVCFRQEQSITRTPDEERLAFFNSGVGDEFSYSAHLLMPSIS